MRKPSAQWITEFVAPMTIGFSTARGVAAIGAHEHVATTIGQWVRQDLYGRFRR